MLTTVRGFKQSFGMTIRGGCTKVDLVAMGLASELRGSIGARISVGKVFKSDF